jgi:hypothetical protein
MANQQLCWRFPLPPIKCQISSELIHLKQLDNCSILENVQMMGLSLEVIEPFPKT